MTMTENTFMGSFPHNSEASCFGLAVAALLRERYPFHTAKQIASDLDCTIRAAENLLGGHLSAKSITRLTKTYGLGFLIDAGAEVAGTSLQEHLEIQIAKARDERKTWEARERQLAELRTAVRGSRAARGRLDRASA